MSNASVNSLSASPVWVTYETTLSTWTALMLISGMISAVLNSSLILSITFYRHSVHIAGSEILIVHLLFIELCIGGGIVPALALTTAVPHFRSTTESCQIFYFAIGWLVQIEHWSAFFLSFNRLTAILFPLRHRTWSSKPAVCILIGLAWLIPLSTTLPQFLGVAGRFDVNPPWQSCGIAPGKTPSSRMLQVALIAMGSYLPMAGTFATYFVIFSTLQVWRYRKKNGKEEKTGLRSVDKTQKRLRLAKMLFASSLWFMSCYLPFTITLVYFSKLYVAMPGLHLWMRLLYYAGLMGSPVVFLILSRDYRTRLRVVLTRLWKRFEARRFGSQVIPLTITNLSTGGTTGGRHHQNASTTL